METDKLLVICDFIEDIKGNINSGINKLLKNIGNNSLQGSYITLKELADNINELGDMTTAIREIAFNIKNKKTND